MKIKQIVTVVAATSAALVLVGCSTLKTNIFPQGRNKYTIVATASSGGTARQGALDLATKTCQPLGKKFTVLSSKTAYQGPDKTHALAADVAEDVLGAFTGVSGMRNKANDYRTTMKFRCQ